MHRALVHRGMGTVTRMWRSYERQLERRPIATQATTSALLWAAGDVIAQKWGEDKKEVDFRRALCTAGFGATLIGPVGHYWYHWLDKWCAGVFAPGSARFIALKVLLDTSVLGPFYVAAFFAFGSAFIDRTGWPEFRAKMETDFLPTLAAEVTFWPVCQTINFMKVPLQHQLLVVNCVTVLDAAFMSWARNQDDWLGNVLRALTPHAVVLDSTTPAADSAPAPGSGKPRQ